VRVDAAWPYGVGAHARARGLAAQGRGVAVPCAGHWHPERAARRGGGRARKRRVGLLQEKTARRPEGKEVLRVTTEGSSAAHVTVRVFVMLDIYFVSVKYVFVTVKLVCVCVKLLKI
jgi:hypothetical protein